MITLITGLPGSGKTAFAVNEILNDSGRTIDIEGEQVVRRVFVEGITDLALEHEVSEGFENWHVWAPNGAHLILDEAQKVFRPRHASSAVPPAVQEMETHRHRGIDITLITQSPALIDSNVRRLVGRHIHVRSTFMGRYIYEWPEVNDPDSKSARDISASRRYKLPKRVFTQYKSAVAHTKTRYRLPLASYVLAGSFVALGSLAYYAYNSIAPRINPVAAPVAGVAGTGLVGVPARLADVEVTADGLSTGYVSRVPGRPETAPMFDAVRQVVAMPWPSICIASAERCSCYTAQATLLPEVPSDHCRRIVQGGLYNPYADARGISEPVRHQAGTSVAVAPIPEV